MSIKTSRTEGVAEVRIDLETCSGCGLCVEVCKGAPLYMENGQPRVDQSRLFGCIGCGHCAAICPTGSIHITGRDLTPEDMLRLPTVDERASYDQLYHLMLSRRSVREFEPRWVEPHDIEKILAAASTAPMGVPPSEVGVLVFSGPEQVRKLRDDLTATLRGWRKWLTPFSLGLMRPFVGEVNYGMFKQFILPALDTYIEKDAQGGDWFFYNAPLAIYFYGSAYCDPADPLIAATQAMLAGDALGLGTCMLGFPGYIFKYDGKLRKQYGLPREIQPGMAVIFGYPRLHFRKAIRRRFARVWKN